MYRAFKFRLYPDNKQKELINKTFGSSRFIYNYYLNKIKNNNYTNAYSNISDYVNNLKYMYPFLQEVDSIIIRKTLFHLDNNIKRYYNNNFGYSKYKSKYDKNSYTTNAIYSTYKSNNYCNIELDLINKRIKLPKLKWINIRGYRNIDNKYKDLSEREYKCSVCGNKLDRDLNASINIMSEGIKLYIKEIYG